MIRKDTRKYYAEFIGTYTLVLIGCGTAVIAGQNAGNTGISLAFGFALICMAYGIGPISGCHINPAVSLGVYIAGKMTAKDLGRYIIAQIIGAISGAGTLLLFLMGKAGYEIGTTGLGQNGWGPGYLGQYNIFSAFLFELIATTLFVIVILGSTQAGEGEAGEAGAATELAGFAIGIALTGIHLLGIQITGVSVNPARSIGPALFVGLLGNANALAQLPLFLIAPTLGGAIAGYLFRSKTLKTDINNPASIPLEKY